MNVCVGELAEQIRGVSYAKSEALGELRPGFLPIIRATNITDDGLMLDDLVYVPAARVSQKQRLQRGDIVIAASSGSLDVVGKAAQLRDDFEGSFGAFCKVLRPNQSAVDPAYLSHFFRTESYRKRISSLAAGVNINNLKNEHLGTLEIWLPPLNEQRRIAAILDKADALRRKRGRAVELLNSLIQSIFMEMFGDLTESGQFPRGTISDWVETFEAGKNLAPDPDPRQFGGYRVLKVSAVTTGVFIPEEAKPLPLAYQPPASHIIRAGDLLFSRANTAELIGATAYVDRECEKLVLPDKIWRFVWKRSRAPNPRFIQALFSTLPLRQQISKRATGTSGSMKNISQEKVMAIEIAMPERRKQDEFAHRQSYVQRCLSLATSQAAMLKSQFTSLQHRAFSGKL